MSGLPLPQYAKAPDKSQQLQIEMSYYFHKRFNWKINYVFPFPAIVHRRVEAALSAIFKKPLTARFCVEKHCIQQTRICKLAKLYNSVYIKSSHLKRMNIYIIKKEIVIWKTIILHTIKKNIMIYLCLKAIYSHTPLINKNLCLRSIYKQLNIAFVNL